MGVLQKLLDLRSALGGYNAVLYLADRLALQLTKRVRVYRYYFVAQPVSPPMLPERWRRQSCLRVYKENAPDISDLPLEKRVIDSRFAQGAACICAFRHGVLVGCLWLARDCYYEDEVHAVFKPLPADKTAWDFDVYINPDQRGALIFPLLWDAANEWLRGQGVEWSLSRISAFNTASLAAHRRLGARTVGAASFIRLGHVQATFSTLNPRLHVALSRAGAPVFHVPADANIGPDDPNASS